MNIFVLQITSRIASQRGVLDWLNLQVVTMLAEIFMVLSEAKARLVEEVLPSSTSQFVPFSPRSQFVSRKRTQRAQKLQAGSRPSVAAA
jgi:hypothetical protein